MTTPAMPNESPDSFILNDLPTRQDALDFDPYVATLADLVASPMTHTPLTIGVFGDWGSGKTSLMQMMREKLPKDFHLAWFDAWKYEKETTIWRALLLQVLATLRAAIPKDKSTEAKRAQAELSDLETALYRAIDREQAGGVQIDWGKLGLGVAEGAVQIGLAFIPGGNVLADIVKELRNEKHTEAAAAKLVSAIHRERSKIHIEQVQFLEQFQDRFRRLVDRYIRRVDDDNKPGSRLVVFVDDLDRCLPEKAVEVLEAIKLFMDVPGCVFVLGLDQAVIARGIEIKYRELGLGADDATGESRRQRYVIDGARYLEKIIQLPFQIPPIAVKIWPLLLRSWLASGRMQPARWSLPRGWARTPARSSARSTSFCCCGNWPGGVLKNCKGRSNRFDWLRLWPSSISTPNCMTCSKPPHACCAIWRITTGPKLLPPPGQTRSPRRKARRDARSSRRRCWPPSSHAPPCGGC